MVVVHGNPDWEVLPLTSRWAPNFFVFVGFWSGWRVGTEQAEMGLCGILEQAEMARAAHDAVGGLAEAGRDGLQWICLGPPLVRLPWRWAAITAAADARHCNNKILLQ